jgi:hypothetical protein
VFALHQPHSLRAARFVIALVLAPFCHAQSTKAEVLGVVRDPSGGAVQTAILEFLNVSTGAATTHVQR